MKNLCFSLLMLAPLAITACAAEDDSTYEPSCDDGNCDGLLGIGYVEISLSDEVYYTCADSAFDERCANLATHERELVFSSSGESFSASANVRGGENNESAIYIDAQDNRILAPSDRILRITDVASGLNGITSRGGLLIDYRIDGDQAWQTLDPSWYFAYWGNVEIDPALGTAQGTSWACDDGCSSKDYDLPFTPIPAGELVEYRMTLVPIWNVGEFDTGGYTIRFDLK